MDELDRLMNSRNGVPAPEDEPADTSTGAQPATPDDVDEDEEDEEVPTP